MSSYVVHFKCALNFGEAQLSISPRDPNPGPIMRAATTGIVHGIYFGLLLEWRTDLTVQTAFWEMERERHSAESDFPEQDLDSEESLNTPHRLMAPRKPDSFPLAIRKLLAIKGLCRPCLGLTPIAEQHPTTKTLEPSDTFCRLSTLAFATGSFPGRRAEAILDWHRLFDVPACKI